MKTGRLGLAVFVVLLCTGFARAQTPEVSLVYKPGDTVRVKVSFQHPITLERGQFILNLISETEKNQRGFGTQFVGGQFKQLSDTECEISEQVPTNLASGHWRLNSIELTAQGITRSYRFDTDFKNEISIRIENSKHVDFPEIRDVTVKP